MLELIYGLIILILPLMIVFIFLIKWRRDYKATKKILVLYDKKTKYWVIFLIVLLAIMFIIAIRLDYSVPIQLKEWNPNAWHG